MQSLLIERFAKGMKNMIPEDSYRNKPLDYLVIKHILNDIEHKWFGSETDQERNRDLLMTANYTCVTYGYSLIWYDGFCVELKRLMDVINLRKHDRRETKLLVAVMVRFKGEDGDRMNVLPLVNVTLSGIRIRVWLERLVAVLKEYGKTNLLALCDMEGYMLYAASIESVFNSILEEIQIHRDRNL